MGSVGGPLKSSVNVAIAIATMVNNIFISIQRTIRIGIGWCGLPKALGVVSLLNGAPLAAIAVTARINSASIFITIYADCMLRLNSCYQAYHQGQTASVVQHRYHLNDSIH